MSHPLALETQRFPDLCDENALFSYKLYTQEKKIEYKRVLSQKSVFMSQKSRKEEMWIFIK